MLLDRFRSLIVVLTLASTFVIYGTMSVGLAAETVASEESNAANQPWAVFWVSSLSRAMAACDLIFEAADRFDLAETLEDRLKDYHAFAGIARLGFGCPRFEMRARHAFFNRREARLKARTLMPDTADVQLLEARDLALYGRPDGPTFQHLFESLHAAALPADEI